MKKFLIGKFNKWILPEKLYHGTSSIFIQSLKKNGLTVNQKRNSILSDEFSIYLTTSLSMAKSYAKTATKNGGNPIILEVNANNLKADNISFDYNLSRILTSEAIKYSETIKEFKIIKNLDYIKDELMNLNDPVDFNQLVVWDLTQKNVYDYIKNLKQIKNLNFKINKL